MDNHDREVLNGAFGAWMKFGIRDNVIGIRDDYSRGAAMATASAMAIGDWSFKIDSSILFEALDLEMKRR